MFEAVSDARMSPWSHWRFAASEFFEPVSRIVVEQPMARDGLPPRRQQ